LRYVRRAQPDLIYCSTSGYGQTGPYYHRVDHDVNYVVVGILDLIGPKCGPSTRTWVQIADIASGCQRAVTGTLLALMARVKIGTGQYIDISMTDGLLVLLALP